MKMRGLLLYCFVIIFFSNSYCQDSTRWNLNQSEGIVWNVEAYDSHIDHLEMSGLQLSSIVYYGVSNGILEQRVKLVFPMLRTLPNDTHASLLYEIDSREFENLKINGQELVERPSSFSFDGVLAHESFTNQGVIVKRQLFPSTDKSVFIVKSQCTNTSSKPIEITLPEVNWSQTTDPKIGLDGAYQIKVTSDKHGTYILDANQTINYSLIYSGNVENAEKVYVSADYELMKRRNLVENTFSDLVFTCPDEVLNRAFSFAKLRATESIFDTQGGLMHAPGGGRYYAAIWANDQAEYANPFFPYLGNLEGNESAINSFRHFAMFINDEYLPIPSSIIAEGTDIWNGAGDRGDMAMIAYGASRFALSYGDEGIARELWPLIEWCLEYNKRKVNSYGVVVSDSDELEGRFPAGDANLNTSSLYYDALISAVSLGRELGIKNTILTQYQLQAIALEEAIESYFGAELDGFKTYRYYEGNEVLRAWICTPLTVGIFTRSSETIDALFSDKLWTPDGLASASGSTTFWDRATLYALRGVFAAGDTKRAMPFFKKYSKRRLLGEHVPYPVEAYPEGNQRHLSAESALYCRIITEGLFGIRPTGFSTFSLTPNLPDNWDRMELRNIKAFNRTFNIEVKRLDDQLLVKVFAEGKLYLESEVEENVEIEVQL